MVGVGGIGGAHGTKLPIGWETGVAASQSKPRTGFDWNKALILWIYEWYLVLFTIGAYPSPSFHLQPEQYPVESAQLLTRTAN